MKSTCSEAWLVLDKWKCEATPVYVIFDRPEKAVKFSFLGLVENISYPNVQLRSVVSELSANLEGASFRYSDVRELPAEITEPVAANTSALEAHFPDGGTCTFIQLHL